VVPGLDGPVYVHRDEYGVPHVRASTDRDLWVALGFVHAQDRLFQMDLVRRLGSGRVSEWLGEDALEFDVFMGSLELDQRYAEALPDADPELVDVGEAYATGVNAGANALPDLPVEYRLLGVEFEQWQPQDALASTILNSWTLSENAPTELLALMLRDRLSAADATALWRWDPGAPPVDAYWDELRQAELGGLGAPFRGLIEFLWGVEVPSASNNWAVSGSRSADGAPILANDPHLHQFMPSVWYVHEGRGGDVHVAGAALAGTPFPATGHNERVAWGVTNVMADYVDIALVERAGEDGYVLAGETKTLRAVDVDVRVKGRKHPVERTVWWTEIGPVITELEGSHLAVLRWNLLEMVDDTGGLFFALQRAENVEDGVVAARDHPSAMSQNLVLADVDGHIGWQVFGALPNRKAHTGRVPYPASDPAHGWEGWLSDLPGVIDPVEDEIHTANAPPDHPLAHAISTAYLPPWRHDRIGEALQASRGHTPATMEALQRDEFDTHAVVRVAELLEGVDGGRCGAILRGWDGASGVDEVAPAVWAVLQGELIEEVLADRMGESGFEVYQAATVAGRSVLDAELDHFVDDRVSLVEAGLERTCARLESELGPDPRAWRWGTLHPLHIRHIFSDATPLLEGWSLPDRPWGGSHQTINQAGYSWFNDDLHATWIASLRLVTPLSDVGAATFVYPGGQSGHPHHPHYDDLYAPYLAGRSLPLWFDDEDVAAHTVSTLTLLPEAP